MVEFMKLLLYHSIKIEGRSGKMEDNKKKKKKNRMAIPAISNNNNVYFSHLLIVSCKYT